MSNDDRREWPRITRRDFINGASLALGSTALSQQSWSSPLNVGLSGMTGPAGDASYPPGLTGLRGNHEGSQIYPHLLRDGQFSDKDLARSDTGEAYDLVVVGAGISGLSAAYFYRKAFGAGSRILLLDNHDDYGGHAKRNEFHVGDRTLLSYGGTQAIDSPGTYRPVAMALLRELGVNPQKLARRYNQTAYRGLGTGCFFDRQTFGADRLVAGMGSRPWKDFLADSPLSDRAKRDIARLYGEKRDYLPQLNLHEKQNRLRQISYATYLTEFCGVAAETLRFFQTYSHDLFGVGIDSVSALTCYENPDDYHSFTYPGLDGLGLPSVEQEPYIYMYPDGNASIARLLLRALIPAAVSAPDAEAIASARTHYERLDVADQNVRLRLRSPVVRVELQGTAAQRRVTVDYIRDGKAERLVARHCVLACYNNMIPYLCKSLPDDQKAALHYGPKVPFLYTHVAIRNWRAFAQLGVRQIVSPGAYHSYTALAFPVNSEGYRCALHPDDPMVLFMLRAPCAPGLPRKDQHRAGRAELLATPFETIESNIRDQLSRMLGPAGFDGNQDIAAITVNRWAHGYTYEYDSLTDPEWPRGLAPHEIARRPFGPIVIANSDSAAAAYTDAAIDMAFRAVRELPQAKI